MTLTYALLLCFAFVRFSMLNKQIKIFVKRRAPTTQPAQIYVYRLVFFSEMDDIRKIKDLFIHIFTATGKNSFPKSNSKNEEMLCEDFEQDVTESGSRRQLGAVSRWRKSSVVDRGFHADIRLLAAAWLP